MHKPLHQNLGTPPLSFNLRDSVDRLQCPTAVYFCENGTELAKKLICTQTLHSFQFCSYKLEQRQALYVKKQSSPLSVAQHGDVLSRSLEEFIQPVVHNRVRIPETVVCGFNQQLGKWGFVWGLSYQLSA